MLGLSDRLIQAVRWQTLYGSRPMQHTMPKPTNAAHKTSASSSPRASTLSAHTSPDALLFAEFSPNEEIDITALLAGDEPEPVDSNSVEQAPTATVPKPTTSRNASKNTASTRTIKFEKHKVKPLAAPPLSLMDRELQERRALQATIDKRNQHRTAIGAGAMQSVRAEKTVGGGSRVKVFLWVQGHAAQPLTIHLPPDAKVSTVIDMVKQQHTAPPTLPTHHKEFAVLLVDDDDDGTPDEDLPPLVQSRDFANYGVSVVAVTCKAVQDSGFSGATASDSSTGRPSTSRSDSPKARRSVALKSFSTKSQLLMRIHFFAKEAQETHVLRIAPSLTFRDLLALLSKKKKLTTPLAPEKHQFARFTTQGAGALIHMSDRVGALGELDVRLGTRGGEERGTAAVAHGAGSTSRGVSKASGLSSRGTVGGSMAVANPSGKHRMTAARIWTAETATVYTEYRVKKTSDKNKRVVRMLGVDGHAIHSKAEDPAGKGFVKAAKAFGSRSKVYKLGTVLSVHVDPMDPKVVVLEFSEKGTKRGVGTTRQYEAETVTECNEIAGKIAFLLALQRKGKA